MNGNGSAGRIIGIAGPGIASVAGMSIPIAPAIIAVAAVILVRAPFLKFRTAEISLTLLSALGAFVSVVDHSIGAGSAFWLGVGFGGMGSGLIEAGKSSMAASLKERAGKAFAILFNTPDPK